MFSKAFLYILLRCFLSLFLRAYTVGSWCSSFIDVFLRYTISPWFADLFSSSSSSTVWSCSVDSRLPSTGYWLRSARMSGSFKVDVAPLSLRFNLPFPICFLSRLLLKTWFVLKRNGEPGLHLLSLLTRAFTFSNFYTCDLLRVVRSVLNDVFVELWSIKFCRWLSRGDLVYCYIDERPD